MSETLLKRFCASESGTYQYAEPFVRSGWKYATNGRVAVRVRAKGQIDFGNGIDAPAVASVFKLDKKPKPKPWPNTPLVNYSGECHFCNGRGRVNTVACADCGGNGLIRCSSCSHENECTHCDGAGWRGGTACPDCLGRRSGDVPHYRKVGKLAVRADFDRLIRSLPELMWTGNSKKIVHFKFSGGEGVVMKLLVSA